MPAQDPGFDLAIDGMTCAGCAGRVERALRAVPGVDAAAVNVATGRARVSTRASLATGIATVRLPEGAVTNAALAEAVRAAGYAAESADGPAVSEEPAGPGPQRRALALAAALTLPLVLVEMAGHLVPGLHHWLIGLLGQQALNAAQFVLATVVLFGPGRRFFTGGWPALVAGAPDMNSLVMLGTGAAWAYSTVATFAPDVLPPGTRHVYFEAAAVIVTLILAGHYLEALARGRAGAAVRKLIGLAPKTARAVRAGGEAEVEIGAIAAGDLLRVRPGERVPVDGEVVEGRSWIDEAMITGEPEPAAKGPGAEVIGGTINRTGSFTYRATRVGGDTVLAQIVRMVEEAQAGKLPIQALADRVTLWFVPAVLLAAAATVGLWLAFGPQPALTYALVNAVAVLIVACPCAMGLATPTSILVGTARAAELGVLFRNGAALQGLRAVEVVAFDKTGTLTEGRPRLTDMELADGFARDEVLALVAAAERGSEHPVGRALVAAAEAAGLPVPEAEGFEAVAGQGVTARVGGVEIAVGTAGFLGGLGLDTARFAERAARLAGAGRSPLFAAIGGRPAAVMAVADPVKPGAPAALAALRGMGLRVVMVTGDSEGAARAVAARLGIDEVAAEVRPDGKVAALRALQAEGRKVAFVGDGINDAPALAQADVGIAIGGGTDIAIEAADVVLMSGDLGRVPTAIALSRATIRNIWQNLFWAFVYNAALIPVAMGVLYPSFGILMSPIFGAAAMAASDICVLGNALRLKRFGRVRGAGATPARPAEAPA